MCAVASIAFAALLGQAVAPPPRAIETVTLQLDVGSLAGTLTVPSTPSTPPVALIIAGSGPTDRDGNSAGLPGKNDSYRWLADALANAGIASLRYDKRGIGASRAAGAVEANLRFDLYVDDAQLWLDYLRKTRRFSRLIVIGHSEGSLIGMLAARRARADGFVSIAGVASGAATVLRQQLRPQIGGTPALWEANEQVLASLETGQLVTTLPPALQSVPALARLYRASVQPYLISWFMFTPAREIAALEMPVLIIQGTNDIQVSIDEATALKQAKPPASLVLVDGMNHVMKRAPADRAQNIATYSDPTLPIMPEVPTAIAAFVRAIARP